MDVKAQLDAVQRSVTTGSEAEPVRTQRLAQDYPSSITDVWEAITTPDRIGRWFLPVTGDLRPGGHYQLEGNASGEVLECRPPVDGAAHYRVTWAYGGGADTWLTVRLVARSESRTRLELEHIARVADVPEELWSQFGPAATGIGWDQGLLGLALHLSGDQSGVTPEEAMAWMLSDEGRRFARGSADAWAAAHIADGGDPATAARAADATYTMYTQAPDGGTSDTVDWATRD